VDPILTAVTDSSGVRSSLATDVEDISNKLSIGGNLIDVAGSWSNIVSAVAV